MGSLFAARLALAGEDVTLVSRPSPHLEIIQQAGLTLVENDGSRQAVPIPATRDPIGVSGADLVILLVKAWATAEAISAIRPYLSAATVIHTLQNGLGNQQAIRDALGDGAPQPILVGVTSQAALRETPGVVHHAGTGPTRIGGGREPSETMRRAVARLLTAAGIPTDDVTNIEWWIWQKVAINVAINGLTALMGEANGALLRDDELRLAARTLANEVAAVAASQGFDLGEIALAVEEVVAATAANRSSMLRDLETGSRTEVEAIHFAVLDVAAVAGVDVPATRVVSALLKHREGHAARQTTDHTRNRNVLV